MRVDLATQVERALIHVHVIIMLIQVLSSSVSKALTLFVGEDAMATAKFTEMFDRFFDCQNVFYFSEGKDFYNSFKTPYY